MGSNHQDLAAIIQRYGQVANAVNQREMERLIEEVRQKWATNPPPEVEHLYKRGEGWTEEGAFALCIRDIAGLWIPDRQGQRCEAEEMDQVLLHVPVDELVNEIPAPLADPAPLDKMVEKAVLLRAQLQTQSDQSASSNTRNIELPEDFKELMSVTNGINGAGVPAVTDQTVLVHSLNNQRAGPTSLEYISDSLKRRGYVAQAGWELGSSHQHRQIYYVSCHKTNDTDDANDSWRIFDRADVNIDMYESLAHFLQHETAYVEENPGGAQQNYMVVRDCYPF
ncbi:hypothetical protein LTR10_012205 [Elasticomyces elasticus]|nr:hypothetical protein LTR10_012205 [Elasticomyces elasticus]KAK4965685.1 hypothetical protein LTR42_011698 [Elasticomyces elasticus]